MNLSALAPVDRARLKNSAKIAQAMEDQWAAKISSVIEGFTSEVLESLAKSGKPPQVNLVPLFCEHFFEVSISAIKFAQTDLELLQNPKTKLAKPPAIRIPKSLQSLMKLYDAYRKGKFKPKRAVAQAKAVQKAYLEKVKSVWERHSKDWRSGDVATQERVVQKIQEAAKTTASRAKNIVRTETTSYYNTARKTFYDESVDITHYLFVAIRDAGTSPWCTPLTVNGYRGRDGLVYAKADPLCAKECPACHPGCRSEFLPLNRLNPAHLRFIQDRKIQRREHNCFPLLKGWKAA